MVSVALGLVGLFGLSWALLTSSPSESAMGSDDSEGRFLFTEYCSRCHGESGAGNGSEAHWLTVPPSDLTITPNKRSNTPLDLYRILITGINGTPMPAYDGILPDEQLWGLVYYVNGLAVETMPTADIPAGLGMMGMGMMRGMPGRMGFVGEESIGMMIDMPAARAWKMGAGMPGRRH